MATVEYLVVAGGGSGGSGLNNDPTSYPSGAGGGAGGFRTGTGLTVTAQAYTVTVGTGAPRQTSNAASGTNGEDSVFSTITSTGGGAGGGGGAGTPASGGSGGGGGNGTAGASGTGGQGNSGGAGDGDDAGGGGGGASASGAAATATQGGNGGAGTSSSISGAAVTYAGGGGGGCQNGGSDNPGTGGAGGGGNGGDSGGPTPAQDGTANRGGGGGGGQGVASGSNNYGGAGGDGIVIIRYPLDGSTGVSTTSTGGTITTSGGYRIHTFTSDGTFTAALITAATDIKNDSSLGANLSLVACTTTTVTEDLVSANTSYFTNNFSVTTATGKNATTGTASQFTAASTQSLSVADNTETSPTGDMSVATWIYLDSAVTGRQVLCGKDASQPNRSYAFNLQESTGDNFEVLLSTNGQNAGTNNYRTNAGMTFSTSTWYHVVMAYNSGAGTIACYVNGALQVTITGTSSGIYDSTAAFYIARWQDASAYFDGRMNQFLLYKKLLTADDAANLWNSGNAIPYNATSSVNSGFLAFM